MEVEPEPERTKGTKPRLLPTYKILSLHGIYGSVNDLYTCVPGIDTDAQVQ